MDPLFRTNGGRSAQVGLAAALPVPQCMLALYADDHASGVVFSRAYSTQGWQL
jgi:hypothetical protein